MQCELCGREEKDLKRISIEGSLLLVCERCARFGSVAPIAPRKLTPLDLARGLEKRKKFLAEKDIFAEQKQELVENYAELVRKGRLNLGLTPEQLGKLINERRTVIIKLESSTLRPDELLVKKLEKALKVKLTSQSSEK